MLADVHEHFEIPAVYLTHATGTPVAVTVRLHRKQIVERPPLGESDLAAMLDIADRIIFKKSQLPAVVEGVMSNAFVIFGPEEAYITGPSKPMRENYIWVEVTEIGAEDLTALIGQVDLGDPAWGGILTDAAPAAVRQSDSSYWDGVEW